MIRLEDELESFLEATQDPAAWLMVFAAKDEIERLNARLKVVRDQYNGDTNICHELMKEALGDED